MDRGRGKKKGLSLPAHLISRIDGDDFNNAEWQKSHNMGGKRKSRKDSRKELRQSKRIKRMPAKLREQQFDEEPSEHLLNTPRSGKKAAPKQAQRAAKPEPEANAKKRESKQPAKPFVSAHELDMRRKEEEDAKYYAKKLGLKGLKLNNDEDGMGDILGDLDFDDFAASQDEKHSERSESESESDESKSDGFDDAFDDASDDVIDDASADDASDGEGMTAQETMAKLAALKAKKSGSGASKPAPQEKLRVVREEDLSASDDSSDEDDDFDSEPESSGAEMTAEETMAKLAALKAKKSGASERAKPSKSAPVYEKDDSINDSDFDDGDASDSAGEEMTAEETMAKLAALKAKKNKGPVAAQADNDSFSEGDFDSDEEESEGTEMTAEETMRKLAELKKKKNLGSQKNGASGSSGSEAELASDSESEDDENPYLPPSRRNKENADEDASVSAKASAVDSEAVVKMRRVFKGALNRLTESTFSHVVNEIELAFSKNSRAEASEVLTEQILENISGSQSLQHSFFVVYGGLIAALYRSMGTSFAASFIQSLVEGISKQSESTINFLTLLVECYCLHVVSSRLMYDLVKDCLQNITDTESEYYVEQVLVIIRNGGSLLRTDDPLALKEVILILQQRIGTLGGSEALPPRMRFLVDTIVALKNNRQKPTSELVVALRHRLRKFLQGGSANASKEPLQVGLEDIKNSSSKGKWWLVGASWKGSEANVGSRDGPESSVRAGEDEGIDEAAPDWLELAKKQRLNTDVRRAVFVALMGAEDYLDACLRIDKLGLKNKQERDIPHVILHCLGQEPVYNPYYALVAGKQCTRHSTRKTFQFRLFDWLDAQSQGNTQLAMHYGRFYASLVLQKVLGLDILKAVDFLGAAEDVQVFLEIFFVTLYRELGKQAEKDARRHLQQGLARVDGKAERDGRELTLLMSKCKDEKVLRGVQLVTRTVVNSEAIRNERDRERILWCAELASDMVDELVKRGGASDEI